MADMSAEHRAAYERQRDFNNTAPGLFAQYCEAAAIGDARGQLARLEFVRAAAKLPNLEFHQKMTLLGINEDLSFAVDVPAISALNLDPLGVKEASVNFSMTTHTTDNLEEINDHGYEGSMTAEGKIGYGPFSLSAKVTAKCHSSNHSDRKRTTDQTATTDVAMTVGRLSPPETLSKIMDSMGEVTQLGMQLNSQLLQKQIANASAQISESDGSVAEDSPNGGDSQ